MPEISGMPPKLLRFDIMLSDQAPTLARIQMQSDNGTHGFLVKRDILEAIARLCFETACKMPRERDLS